MRLLNILFAVLPCLIGTAQNSIRGTVYKADGKTPLPDVSVYLPQLEKGAVTDSLGRYAIDPLPSGSFKIIASYIGYGTYSGTVRIVSGISQLDILMFASAIEMQEVIVSTPFHRLQRENVMKVEQASVTDMRNRGAITLADGISGVPGVSSLSTGLGIGKPVIRGLSSNRVLVYAQGIRLENQQFGEEHGLGINEAGIESVEVIKGPASLLYGSDAMGGVLYLNPEKFAQNQQTTGDVNLNYFSNTAGIGANAGIKSSTSHFRYLLRGASTTHQDYHSGDDQRVTNSRFREYDLKSGIAYQGTKFKTELRYNFNHSNLGIPEEIADQNASRVPEPPFQKLNNHILSSSSDLFLKESSLKWTLGYIFNDRREFEIPENSGNGTQTPLPLLDMNLSTLSYQVQYRLPENKRLETIIGLQGMRQQNKNEGVEVLIPNALTNDFGVMATAHLHFSKSDLQFGARFDHRNLSGEPYGNSGDASFIAAVDRNFNSGNAAVGYRIDLHENIIGRLNFASGFRAPNLAELTSNGVHEGTNRYEVGNQALQNEQNLQSDLALEFSNEHVEFYVNGFYNPIRDYIFPEPTGEFIESAPVFTYRQQNAKLYGGEIGMHLHPHPIDWLHLESSYEMVRGTLENDANLPLIPANNLRNTARIEFTNRPARFSKSYAFITLQSVFKQLRVSKFETTTNGYQLLDLGFGGSLKLFEQEIAFRFTANNFLNKTYISHLSRLKPDGIPNIGRNISLGISLGL